MVWSGIPSGDTDAKSPIDQTLMDLIRTNDADHETRLLALEAGGGTGGAGAAAEDPRVGEILRGLEDNTARFSRYRFHVESGFLGESPEFLTAFDPESSDPKSWESLAYGDQGATTTTADATTIIYLRNNRVRLKKSEKLYFKVKRGFNFFGLGYGGNPSTTSDGVEVKVNGVAVNTLGLVDENGTAHGASFSTTGLPTTIAQIGKWFFGLDPNKEHIVEVLNNDSGSDDFFWEYVEMGYATPPSEVAVGFSDVRLTGGQATIRGSSTAVAGSTLTFEDLTDWGRTDLVAITTAGATSVVRGASPAFTQVKPDESIEPGTTTTFEVKNNYYFPEKGILQVQVPYGPTFMASYTGRTRTNIHQNSFDGVIWNSSYPSINALSNFTTAVSGSSPIVGDITCNLVASCHDGTSLVNAIEVSASNNKLDFSIQKDNDVSANSFTATIPSGVYTGSKALMYLGEAIQEQMEAVAPLTDIGQYFAEYDTNTHKWCIGVRGNATVVSFNLLWSSGANSANSIHTDMGFDTTDQTGALDYTAQNEKEHDAWRVYDRGKVRGPDYPGQFYSAVDGGDLLAGVEEMSNQSGLILIRQENDTNYIMKVCIEDEECVGAEFTFVTNDRGSYFTYQVDNGQILYPIVTDRNWNLATSAGTKRHVITFQATWPKGTKEILINSTDQANPLFNYVATATNYIGYAGYRPLFSHPPLERLTTSQAALPKYYSIRPKVMYREDYGDNFSAPGDKIDTITYSGSWAATTSTSTIAGRYRSTSTLNDYVDVTFTTTDDGGGFALKALRTTGMSQNIAVYLASGAAGTNAAANLIQRLALNNPSAIWDQDVFVLTGLDAGQYTVRIRKEDATNGSRLNLVTAFGVIDGTESEPDTYRVDDLTNSLRGLSYPYTGRNHKSLFRDALKNVPALLDDSGFRQGIVECDYGTGGIGAYDAGPIDENQTFEYNPGWYGSNLTSNSGASASNEFIGIFEPVETIMSFDQMLNANSTGMQPIIDGTTKNSYSQRLAFKGGATNSSATIRMAYPLFKKNFFIKASGNMSDVNTIPISNTDGIRVGQSILVMADGQATESRTVSSIVANTSIDINRDIAGFASYTTANNLKVVFSGMHRVKIEKVDAVAGWYYNAIGAVPLPVRRKDPLDLDSGVGETVVSYAYGVVNGDDIPPPIYKDGTLALWAETSVTVLNNGSTANTWDFPEGFNNISITGSAMDFKFTSTRRRD